MTTRVAINGFGRIGRSVLRILIQRSLPHLAVVAVNDLADDDVLAYLLRYDSVMGRLDQEVGLAEGVMTVGRHEIRMLCEPDPSRLPWDELGVDVVVESTGVFRTRSALTKHLEAGAKRVILTVPPKDALDLTLVLGVNDHLLGPDASLISNASCTTNCLAPLAKILHDHFEIRRGLMTTVHAYTNDQRLADVPHADLRRSRAATENIIPTSTGAAKAVGKVLPELDGKAGRDGDARAGSRWVDSGPGGGTVGGCHGRRTERHRTGRGRRAVRRDRGVHRSPGRLLRHHRQSPFHRLRFGRHRGPGRQPGEDPGLVRQRVGLFQPGGGSHRPTGEAGALIGPTGAFRR